MLIIASIIEEEAATAHDRPLVASVIYNRLKDGIALGMDSTTRYEFNDYTKPLTSSQLSARSPYNTRLNKGLPPTPIGNPGLSAIEAAAHPAQTNYLYFVVKPCGNGASVFSSNYNQFLADSARYQSARARTGGRSPTDVLRRRCATAPASASLGWPVAHSRSPRMQNAALARVGLGRLALPAAAGPAGAVRRDGARRCRAPAFAAPTSRSRTSRPRCALADEASDAARAIGAANTLLFERDGRRSWPTTPTRPALIGALPFAPRGQDRARARRRRQRPRSRLGAARRRRRARCCVWNRTPSAPAS